MEKSIVSPCFVAKAAIVRCFARLGESIPGLQEQLHNCSQELQDIDCIQRYSKQVNKACQVGETARRRYTGFYDPIYEDLKITSCDRPI